MRESGWQRSVGHGLRTQDLGISGFRDLGLKA